MNNRHIILSVFSMMIIAFLSSCKSYDKNLYNHSISNNLPISITIDSTSIYKEFYYPEEYLLYIFGDRYRNVTITKKYGYMFDKKELKSSDTISNTELCKIFDNRFVDYKITRKNRVKIPGYGTVGEDGKIVVNNQYVSKQVVFDVLTIFDNYANSYNNNLAAKNAQYHIRLGVSNIENTVDIVYTIPSVLTLTLINLLGFPIAAQGAEVSLKAIIYNRDNEIVDEIDIEGKAKKYSAYYWGYSGVAATDIKSGNGDLHRVTVSYAIKDALDKLDKVLENRFQ